MQLVKTKVSDIPQLSISGISDHLGLFHIWLRLDFLHFECFVLNVTVS